MTRKMLPALVLALLPTVCYADVGDLGSIVVVVLDIFLAIWIGLSIMVFLINRRKVSVWKRLGLASLFFIRGHKLPAGTYISRSGDGRHEAARHLMLALRAALEQGEFFLDAEFERLIVSRLEVQARHMVERAPIAAV
jgi:hypothetical protein